MTKPLDLQGVQPKAASVEDALAFLATVAADQAAYGRFSEIRWVAEAIIADNAARRDALAWLADNQNCELSFDYGDEHSDGERWCVHRVNGGRNDREWTLIGTGATPEAALSAARNSRERL